MKWVQLIWSISVLIVNGAILLFLRHNEQLAIKILCVLGVMTIYIVLWYLIEWGYKKRGGRE